MAPFECNPTEDSYIAILVFTVAAIGFTVNTWNCTLFYLNRQNRTAFSYLWMSRCASNSIILFIFMFYESPTIVCNSQFPNQSVAYFIGNTTGSYYLAILFVQILLAVHRFMASVTHRYYSTLGTLRSTLIQLGVVWIISAYNTVQWLIEKCEFYFDEEWYSWEEDCPDELLIELSTPIPVKITIVTVILLNLATYLKLYRIQKRKTVTNNRTNVRLRNNFRLLWHGTIHDSFYLLDIINQEYTSRLSDSKWWNLLCYSISWECAHLFDGIAMLLLNEDLRRPLIVFFSKKTVEQLNTDQRLFSVSRIIK